MIRPTIAALLLMFGAATPLIAQHRYLSALEYSVAVPVGDTRRFEPGWSWSGAVWEGRWMDRPHTSIGALLGFNEFYRRQDGTFNFPGGTVTGDQYRHLLTIPILFTAAWYFSSNYDDPRWYIGGGGGLQYTEQLYQLGIDQRHRGNWGFMLVPEVGLAFSAWYATGGILALRYHMPTQSGGFLGSSDRRYEYLSLSLGIGYR